MLPSTRCQELLFILSIDFMFKSYMLIERLSRKYRDFLCTPSPSTHSIPCYCFMTCEWVNTTQACLTLCDPMDYTVYRILQSRILERVAFPFSRGFSQPRDRTQVSCIAGRFLTSWAAREALRVVHLLQLMQGCLNIIVFIKVCIRVHSVLYIVLWVLPMDNDM